MTAGAVGELDGIVIVELSLDEGHEVEHVIACLRAGANAWAASPFAGVVDQAMRPKHVERVLAVALELEDEARRVHGARNEAYRRRGKAAEKASRARKR